MRDETSTSALCGIRCNCINKMELFRNLQIVGLKKKFALSSTKQQHSLYLCCGGGVGLVVMMGMCGFTWLVTMMDVFMYVCLSRGSRL